jgi:predicted anti-sigma-YlaC factor YlaD
MNCKETQRNIFDYLDGVLDEHNTTEIENHLAICSDCSSRVSFIGSALDGISVERIVEPDSEFTGSVMLKIDSPGRVISLRERFISIASAAAIVLVALFTGTSLARLASSGQNNEGTLLYAEDVYFEPIESFFLLNDQE